MVNQVGKLRRKQPKRSPCWPCDRRRRRRSHGQQGEPGCSNRSVISQRTLFTIQASWMGSQIPQATAFLARKEWHGDFACLPAHTCKNSVRPLHGSVHWTTSLEPCQHRSCRSPTTMPVCPASCTALTRSPQLAADLLHVSCNCGLSNHFNSLANAIKYQAVKILLSSKIRVRTRHSCPSRSKTGKSARATFSTPNCTFTGLGFRVHAAMRHPER
jgi:hypothetical protein